MAKSLPIESTHIEGFAIWPEDVVINRDTKDGPEHPCWRDDAKRAPTLVDTLLSEKQIQEIVVRKQPWMNPDTETLEERVELILGVDRTVSMREINAKGLAPVRQKIRCRVVAKGTTDEQIVRMIEAENARRKVDMDPIRKAESAKRMLDFGVDEASILRVQGMKHMDSVKRNVTLLGLTKTAKAEVAAGKMPVSLGLTLAALPASEQDAKVSEWKANPESMPTVKEAQREVKELKKAPSERSNKAEGEVGPPNVRMINKMIRILKKSDEEKKPSLVSDHFSDVLSALYSDDATRGSLPANVFAALRWLRTGKGVTKIAGLTKLINAIEK